MTGAIPLTEIVEMVERYAYKQVHVAYNALGAKIGLKGQATVQVGPIEDGHWWNLRVGHVPEFTTWQAAEVEDYEDLADFFLSLGMTDQEAQDRTWKIVQRGRRPRYFGWRSVLFNMLKRRVVRPNPMIEKWLGPEMYERAMQQRKEVFRG